MAPAGSADSPATIVKTFAKSGEQLGEPAV